MIPRGHFPAIGQTEEDIQHAKRGTIQEPGLRGEATDDEPAHDNKQRSDHEARRHIGRGAEDGLLRLSGVTSLADMQDADHNPGDDAIGHGAAVIDDKAQQNGFPTQALENR